MEIKELKTAGDGYYDGLSVLMNQLSSRLHLTRERLESVLSDDNVNLYLLMDDDRVAGCAELCIYESLSARKGVIEEVVILDEYRGRGLGRRLLEHVLDQARSRGPMELFLTSNSSRIAANGLYRSLGFKQKDTNCYRMDIGF